MLPTLWFRNTWSWSGDARRGRAARAADASTARSAIDARARGATARAGSTATGAPRAALHRERDQHASGCSASPNARRYVKDGINDYVVHGARDAVNPGARRHEGGGALRARRSPAGGVGHACGCASRRSARTSRRRRRSTTSTRDRSTRASAKPTSSTRRVIPRDLSATTRSGHAPGLGRAAVVEAVLPLRRQGLARGRSRRSRRRRRERRDGRNHEWTHLYNADVISMPDKWEYPWYAAWDLAFHCVPLALVDPDFAKEQLVLMLREWYMHPNGQLPPTSGRFGDVNPPVHAWAAWRVYKIEKKRTRRGRPRVPRARLPQAAAQLHLVGEPQGRRGQQRLPGRLPRPRQHRRLRSQSRRCRPAATSSSRTARAGWRCTAQPARHRAGAGARRTRPTRTSRASSGSTSSTSRTR